jgi:aspartate/methionine/tyrosine aminotransferase
MRIEPFQLERYFAKHEFSARYLLGASDCEALSMRELLDMASPQSLALWEDLRLGYTESQGHRLLLDEIAGLYETVEPAGVLAAGPQEAIFLAMQTLVGPGDHAIVLTPAYQSLHEIARSAGCDITEWRLRAESGRWHLDFDELRRGITKATRLIVVNFPNNPTGYLPSLAEFERVVEMALDHGLYLFSDEMYRYLEHNPAERLPAACDVYEKAISLSGLSKSFGLAGLRMGWLACHDRSLIERWLALKDYTTICHSAPSEILAIVALRAKERIIDRNREIVLENLALAEPFFSSPGEMFGWMEPRGGSIAFPEWRGGGSVEDWCAGVLREQGVMVVPGGMFQFPGNHFRVGLGRRNFKEVLDVLLRQ